MGITLAGLLLVANAPSYALLLLSVGLIGVGSSIFHPESSRIARLASGGQHGLAQSLFQVGGNAGSSMGPLLAAYIVLPAGQRSLAWFGLVALVAIVLLARVGRWYASHPSLTAPLPMTTRVGPRRTPRHVVRAVAILVALLSSKNVYMVSLTSFYTFYLMNRFSVGVQGAQVYLFVFLGSVAAGTFIGGPIGDRIGRKYVIWGSILGVLPFTLALPHATLFWTGLLTVIIGFVLASAFSAILVYAQELMPGRVGVISGTFFGLAFGIAGIAGALLGQLADATSLDFVYRLCSYLPALGLLAAFLPDLDRLTAQPR
jgi:FSR family fosmidomycin resistance protein-like MFS transporter